MHACEEVIARCTDSLPPVPSASLFVIASQVLYLLCYAHQSTPPLPRTDGPMETTPHVPPQTASASLLQPSPTPLYVLLILISSDQFTCFGVLLLGNGFIILLPGLAS